MVPVSIAALFWDVGVTSALIKYIAQYRSEKKVAELKVIARAGLLLNSAVGAILSLTTFLLSDLLATNVFHQPELTILIKVASATLFAQSLLTTSQSIFVGFERMGFHSLTMIVHAILKSLLAPLFVFLGFSTFGAVLGNTATIVVTGILGITIVGVVFLKENAQSGCTLNLLQACKMLLNYGYPLFLSALLAGALSRFYSFLMGVYVGASMIGNYQAATNFTVLIAFLTMPISTVLFPLFSRLDLGENSMLRLVFQNSVKYAALITVPVTTALMVLSDQLVQIIYGNSYQFAPFFLKLCIINFLFVGLGNLSVGNLLKGQGKTKINFLAHLVNLCIGVPLGLVLIPRFGIVGLLLTSIITSKPGLVYALWWVKKNFGFTIDWLASAKIYLSAGIASLVTSRLLASLNTGDWVNVFLGGGLFFLVYFLLVPLIGVLEKRDINNLRNIMSELGPLTPLLNMFLTIVEKLMRKTSPQ